MTISKNQLYKTSPDFRPPQMMQDYQIYQFERGTDPFHKDAFHGITIAFKADVAPRKSGWIGLDYLGNAITFVPDGTEYEIDGSDLSMVHDFYIKRTLEHIHKVHKRAAQVAYALLDIAEMQPFMEQIVKHDASKFAAVQYTPYMGFSWNKKQGNEIYEHLQVKFDQAWRAHYIIENHHPEKKGATFTRFQAYEVACDLQAMADEFGEGICSKYFADHWVPKQRDNFDNNQFSAIVRWIADAIQVFNCLGRGGIV